MSHFLFICLFTLTIINVYQVTFEWFEGVSLLIQIMDDYSMILLSNENFLFHSTKVSNLCPNTRTRAYARTHTHTHTSTHINRCLQRVIHKHTRNYRTTTCTTSVRACQRACLRAWMCVRVYMRA